MSTRTTVKVRCPDCRVSSLVQSDKLEGDGIRVLCPSCKGSFFIGGPDRINVVDSPPPDESPQDPAAGPRQTGEQDTWQSQTEDEITTPAASGGRRPLDVTSTRPPSVRRSRGHRAVDDISGSHKVAKEAGRTSARDDDGSPSKRRQRSGAASNARPLADSRPLSGSRPGESNPDWHRGRWQIKNRTGSLYKFPGLREAQRWASAQQDYSTIVASSDDGDTWTPLTKLDEFRSVTARSRAGGSRSVSGSGPRARSAASRRTPKSANDPQVSGLAPSLRAGDVDEEKPRFNLREMFRRGHKRSKGASASEDGTADEAEQSQGLLPEDAAQDEAPVEEAPQRRKSAPGRKPRSVTSGAFTADESEDEMARERGDERTRGEREKPEDDASSSSTPRLVALLVLLITAGAVAAWLTLVPSRTVVPNSPAGDQFGWVLGVLNSGVDSVGEEQLQQHFAPVFVEQVGTERLVEALDNASNWAPSFRFVRLEGAAKSHMLTARIQGTNGRMGLVTISTERDPPHRIRLLNFEPAN